MNGFEYAMVEILSVVFYHGCWFLSRHPHSPVNDMTFHF